MLVILILIYKYISFVLLKKRFRCHHNTRPKIGTTPSQKHYNCKATLGLKIIKDLRFFN